ncbi:unnamed protein product [Prunus armeniaca]
MSTDNVNLLVLKREEDVATLMIEFDKCKDTIKVKAFKPSKQHIIVSWQPSLEGRYKLNTDCCRSEDGAIVSGRVVRDYSGAWLGGLSANMGFRQVMQTELWALYHEIVLACHREWFPLDIEYDSQIAMQMLSSELEEELPFYSLVTSYHKMLRSKDCNISHKYSEENCLADKLTPLSSKLYLGCRFWEGVPERLDVIYWKI